MKKNLLNRDATLAVYNFNNWLLDVLASSIIVYVSDKSLEENL